jgi:ketosteroid isomerase-like protein
VADRDEILTLIEARIEAMHRKDAAAALATLAEDVVAFELAPPLAMPAEAVRDPAAMQAWFDGFDGPIEIECRDLAIERGGDIALAHSLNRMRATRKGGAPVDFWMRSTLGFRRIDGAWKISHGHSSVPFAMDGSFRALLDLKP